MRCRPAGTVPALGGGHAIQAFLFERPILLIPALVLVQLVIIGVWSRRRTVWPCRTMLAGFVVFPLLVVMQALVETDRERLVDICQAMARAVQHGEVDVFARQVSERFATEGARGADTLDKDGMVELLRHLLTAYDIEEPRLRQFDVEVAGGRAVVRFSAACRVITPEQIVASLPSRWELDFERAGGGWLLTDIRPRPTSVFPYRRLADIPR